ncbi:hypothetical protein [Williamsia deligens]|uniref:Uncharacterized protein n=1 Tax=Williamsia deligens TaxID=321325 RepID=A0ABW3GB36_9NOCA|nr:hypothetical protein [Williamsia deligens]MCP2196140.1 hypothetical protein [Williamsia deligens]
MTAAVRVVLVLVGVAMGVYGITLITDMTTRDQLSILIWAAAGLLVHDGILAPVYSILGHAGSRLLPSTVWAPVLVATAATLVMVLISLPVLAPRPSGERPMNGTILDRPYGLGLALALVVIWVLAGLVAVRNHRSVRTRPVDA